MLPVIPNWPVFRGHEYYQLGVSQPTPQRPIVIPLTNPPKLESCLSGEEVDEIVMLVKASITSSLGRGGRNPLVGDWTTPQNQGCVLRLGTVQETVRGVLPPFKVKPLDPNTVKLEEHLRKVLPLGGKSSGMLLLRVTNLEDTPLSNTIPSMAMSTPWHSDRREYGTLVYSLNILGSSVLTFSDSPVGVEKLVKCCLPDTPGMLWRIEGAMLSAPWVHGVPNTQKRRISLTWRPLTKADPNIPPPEFPFCNHIPQNPPSPPPSPLSPLVFKNNSIFTGVEAPVSPSKRKLDFVARTPTKWLREGGECTPVSESWSPYRDNPLM